MTENNEHYRTKIQFRGFSYQEYTNNMKRILYILILAATPAVFSCSESKRIAAEYDSDTCRELAVKVERRDSISQDDYRLMIEQDKAILQYLVNCSKDISEMPDSTRMTAWKALTSEPEYLEKFGYMFTLGSSLYQADNSGRLDEKNTEAYHELDRYNEELAEYSDRY